MKVTIIHREGCPLCDAAIREFTGDVHDVELHEDLAEIQDCYRRNDMMADLCVNGGDISAYPQVFVEDRYTKWKPKERKES